jgi:hypothetical protein
MRFGPREYLGESGPIAGLPVKFAITARTYAFVFDLPAEAVAALLKRHSDIAHALAATLANRERQGRALMQLAAESIEIPKIQEPSECCLLMLPAESSNLRTLTGVSVPWTYVKASHDLIWKSMQSTHAPALRRSHARFRCSCPCHRSANVSLLRTVTRSRYVRRPKR